METEGRPGTRTTLTRIVKKDGQVVDKHVLHRDVYRPQTEIVHVGTKKPEETVQKPEDAETGELTANDDAEMQSNPPDDDTGSDEDNTE